MAFHILQKISSDKLHAHNDQRCKVLKHVVQKKLQCAYYQYVENIINPSNNDNHLETNKHFGVYSSTLKLTVLESIPWKTMELWYTNHKKKPDFIDLCMQ